VDRELLDVVTIILGSEFKNASVIVAKHILKFNVNGLVKHIRGVSGFLFCKYSNIRLKIQRTGQILFPSPLEAGDAIIKKLATQDDLTPKSWTD
jgi:hypothetical protein